jgi:D-alanyl-D-alanine dipeptidase
VQRTTTKKKMMTQRIRARKVVKKPTGPYPLVQSIPLLFASWMIAESASLPARGRYRTAKTRSATILGVLRKDVEDPIRYATDEIFTLKKKWKYKNVTSPMQRTF